MYLEHFQLHTSPFREEVDPRVFFPEAGRGAICRGLRKDLEEGRLFLKLIGTEGSGKTLLCNVLFESLPEAIEIVYIDDPKGSFDDVLRVVCLDLGLQAVDNPVNLVEELKKRLQQQKDLGRRVVLVIDGAENLFLATLERLLRLLCELDDPNFTLLLVGRPALDGNLEQLTVYCAGVDIHAGYHLEPMSSEETGRYLIFRLLAAGLDRNKQLDVFTGEAVERIYAKAGGNPRLTNILAEEALQRSCSEKSFMVLLDHVDSTADQGRIDRKKNSLLGILQEKKKRFAICAGAGAVVLLILLFFLLPGKEQGGKGTLSKSASPSSGKSAVIPSSASQAKEKGTSVAGPPEPSAPAADSGTAAGSIVQPDASDGNRPVAAITAEDYKKKPAKRDGEALFQERLRASAGWLAGSYRGQYTIQLMMLSSDQAAANVKKLFVQDQYFSILDKLYILRKKTNPPTLFVFYGTFASMEDARQARNRMPIFLRKHHPYALSIADALTKTED